MLSELIAGSFPVTKRSVPEDCWEVTYPGLVFGETNCNEKEGYYWADSPVSIDLFVGKAGCEFLPEDAELVVLTGGDDDVGFVVDISGDGLVVEEGFVSECYDGTISPTDQPTEQPTESDVVVDPTRKPTRSPTSSPTDFPTDSPTMAPTQRPSDYPSLTPSACTSSERFLPLDLTKDLELAPNVNDSPGAQAINEAAALDPLIRTIHLLEYGKIVSSYVRDDVDSEVPWMSWSVTKSYVGLIVGLMIQDGSLESLNLTLGDIFQDESHWEDASDVDFRKNVTILELLTMTSGLISPPMDPNADPNASMMAALDGGTAGGASLADSLAFPLIGSKGEFSYLATSNILSYVIKNITGMSPREYLAENILPPLGIDDSEIGWWKNADGMEYAYHGLELTPTQMAKFGLLYMQKGVTGLRNMTLIAAEWIEASTSVQVQDLPVPFDMSTYGYFFWGVAGNSIWSVLGAGGQDIYIDYDIKFPTN